MSLSERIYATFILDDRYLYFLDGLKLTLILTLGSFIAGSLVAVLFCALTRSKNGAVRKIMGVINSLLVNLPTMVMLMVFVYIVFGDSGLNVIIVAIFALTLKAAAYISDIFSSALETVQPGEIEAARTLGMSRTQAFFYVIFPQAVSAAKPVYKNQFVSTMQETSVVGYIASMDLTRASSVVTARTLDALFCLIVVSIIYLILGAVGQGIIGMFGKKKHLGGDNA